jgi:hypothetical protein
MLHLVASISGHGFGHVAQTAPILNMLHQRMPQLRLTVRSAVPLAHLRSRIHAPFTHLPDDSDIGMLMSSALDVRVVDCCAAYREFHTKWNERVAVQAAMLRELKADFVFSNVGYLPLAGAQRAGIPNAALCSLNWADIYRHYCCDASDSVRADPSTAPARGTPVGAPRYATTLRQAQGERIVFHATKLSPHRYMPVTPTPMPFCAPRRGCPWPACPTSFPSHPSPQSARTGAQNSTSASNFPTAKSWY